MAKALVIDDEDIPRESYAEMLEGLGYDVVKSESSIAGIQLMKDGYEFDLVFCDVVNSGPSGHVGGVDTAEYVLANHPFAKLVMISGTPEIWKDTIKIRPQAAQLQALPFIVKNGVPIKEMEKIIQAAVSRRAAGKTPIAEFKGDTLRM